MTTPIVRINAAANITVTSANSVANNAFANSADVMRLQQSAMSIAALLADFRLTSVTFATAPVGGLVQLVLVDRKFDGTQGPTPASTLMPNRIYTFSPVPLASNASTGWTMGIDGVPLTADQDAWLYNNGTAYTLNSGWVLTAQPWSPGT